jgi:WD40 repeat protein
MERRACFAETEGYVRAKDMGKMDMKNVESGDMWLQRFRLRMRSMQRTQRGFHHRFKRILATMGLLCAGLLSTPAQCLAQDQPTLVLPTTRSFSSIFAKSPDGKYAVAGSENNDVTLWELETGRLMRTFPGHTGRIIALAFTPDGKHVLSGAEDRTVRKWDLEIGKLEYGHLLPNNTISINFSRNGKYVLSGTEYSYQREYQPGVVNLWKISAGELKLMRTFEGHGHTEPVESVVISPDGKYALSGAMDQTAKLWEVSTGEVVHTFECSSHVYSVAFSPDGKYAVGGSGDGSIVLWDIPKRKKKRILEGHDGFVRSVAFSPDGKFVLSGGRDAIVRLWDIKKGKLLKAFEGHDAPVLSVAFSPDGKSILSGGRDGTMRWWDVSTGELLQTFEESDRSIDFAIFSPDSRYVISRDGYMMNQWDVLTGEKIRTYEGHPISSKSVAFSPNGHYMLSAAEQNSMKLWNLRTGELLKTFDGDDSLFMSVAYSQDGKLALSKGISNRIKLWDIATGEPVRTFQADQRVRQIAFSSNEKMISGGSYGLEVFDIQTGNVLHTWKSEEGSSLVSISPDGRYAVLGGRRKDTKIWDESTGSVVCTFDNIERIECVSFSPDGRHVALGTGDNLELWDISTRKRVHAFECEYGIRSVTFSPDGQYIVSGGSNYSLQLWDVSTKGLIHNFKENRKSIIERSYYTFIDQVSFSPDGKYVLSASQGDNWVKLWDVSTGKLVHNLEDYKRRVQTVSFSPDGEFALSNTGLGHLDLWHLSTGQKLLKFEPQETRWQIRSATFSPDGKYVLSSSDNTLSLWEVGNVDTTVKLSSETSKGRLVKIFAGHTDRVASVSFDPEAKYAISGSRDNTINFWNIGSGGLERSFERESHTKSILSVVFSLDGKYALSKGDEPGKRDLILWDVSSGRWVKDFVDSIDEEGMKNWQIPGEESEGAFGTPKISRVKVMAISPDGKHVLSGASDNSIRLWEYESGKNIRTYEVHKGPVWSVAFRPDGDSFFSCSGDDKIRLWDTWTGDVLEKFKEPSGSIIFNPSGDRFLSYEPSSKWRWDERNSLEIWSADTGDSLYAFEGGGNGNFSPDGRYISLKLGEDMKLWEISSRSFVRNFQGRTSSAASSRKEARGQNSISFSPDGDYVLSFSEYLFKEKDGLMELYETATGDRIRTIEGVEKTISSIAFAPDGKSLVVNSGDSFKLWDLESRRLIEFPQGVTVPGDFRGFSSDGKYMLIGLQEKTELRDASTGKSIRTFRGNSAAFSPDGENIATGVNDTLNIWDASTGEMVLAIEDTAYCFHCSGGFRQNNEKDNEFVKKSCSENSIHSFRYSHSGRYLLIAYQEPRHISNGTCIELSLWDWQAKKIIKTISTFTGGQLRSLAISPDGESVFAGFRDYVVTGQDESTGRWISERMGFVEAWDISTGDLVHEYEFDSYLSSITLSPDGSLMLINPDSFFDFSESIKLLKISSKKILHSWDGYASSFSRDGKQIAIGKRDGTVELRELSTDELLYTFPRQGHSKSMNFALFSPDGKQILSGSEDRSMKLWDVLTGQLIQTFTGHTGDIISAVFSADGKRIISSSGDNTMRYWDVSTGQPLLTRVHLDRSDWVTMTPDGRFDGSSDGLQQLYYVHGNQSKSINLKEDLNYVPGLMSQVLSETVQERRGVAVVIGNRNYAAADSVKFAHNDSQEMRKVARQILGFREVMKKSDKEQSPLDDMDRASLRELFGTERNPEGHLYSTVRSGEPVLIYLTGHGHSTREKGKAYLVPTDGRINDLEATCYPLDMLYKNLTHLLKRKKPERLILILDTCFSGYLATDMASARWESDNPLKNLRDEGKIVGTEVVCVLATQDDQTAKWHHEKKHSLLTYVLLRAFRNLGEDGWQPDKNEDGRLTVGELQDFVLDDDFGVPFLANQPSIIEQADIGQKPKILGEKKMMLLELK